MELTIMKIIFFVLVVLLPITGVIGKRSEAKRFNGGKCRECGEMLRYFDTDSQGGRGYVCDKCGYVTWCSYNVDKQYNE